jgi:hypothetical protein
MSLVANLKTYARFGWGLHSFLRETITLEEARDILRRRLAEREASFLRLIEKGIFGYPPSPYLPLLRLAQAELGDIRAMVRDKGLEATLRALREAGVYVGYEEFRGLQPITRHGQVISVQARDFDNPFLLNHYETETGGTTGPAMRIPHDLNHVAGQAPYHMVTRDMHGVLDVPMALWRGILPDGSGINNVLRAARMGRIPERWFSQVVPRCTRRDLKYLLASGFFVAMGRLNGVSIPWPQWVPMADALVVARWAADTLRTHDRCLILTPVSRALRVCLVAAEAGLDLTGTTFMISSEPPTPAKVQGIERAGARHFPMYSLAEVGVVGAGCGQPDDCSDLHLLKDAFALIQCPRPVPNADLTVPAFNLTTLLLTTPKLMLNVEVDDYGVLERRSCGCELESLGFDEHLHHIRSFRKLTGEGVTLVGSEMVRILDEVLPARFGGSPLDYQLWEEEDEQGFTRLSLRISPGVPIADEAQVIDVVLAALRQSSAAADAAQDMWRQAGSLRVVRQVPAWTARGKLMPLHITRRGEP